jgi:protein-S-isoprenylcysteine O-methyltransferase Ste14
MSIYARFANAIVGSVAYFALAVYASGGLQAFFSHLPLIALAIVFFAIAILAFFAGGNISPGVREDRSNRWVLAPFIVIGVAVVYVAPYTDRLGFWTLDGDALRWIGVVLFAVGSTLRIAAVFVLGDRFSGLVAIQPGHTLVTTGLYGKVRNPSYLGLLIGTCGWALAFRSAVGLLLTALLLPPLIARMNSEEKLLRSQFGAEYDAYFAHTSRLIPHIY